jgi:hypothetical protein
MRLLEINSTKLHAITSIKPMKNKTGATRLGHGDHWKAMGINGESLLPMVEQASQQGSILGKFPAPWDIDTPIQLIQIRQKTGSVYIDVIIGKPEGEANYRLLSAFPTFLSTRLWELQITAVHADYGDWEGIVEGTTNMGHSLQWFAPRFGFEQGLWKPGAISRVSLTGLALAVWRFQTEPIKMNVADLPEAFRNIMSEVEQPLGTDSDPSIIEFSYDGLKTVYSSFHDHHCFVGGIAEITPIVGSLGQQGWMLDLQCMPAGAVGVEGNLPLWVFPNTIEGDPDEIFHLGNQVEGSLWLCGEWHSDLTDDQSAKWRRGGTGEMGEGADSEQD